MKTIKYIFIALFLLGWNTAAYSQAKKSNIMVVPSTGWCNFYGFTQEYDDQGVVDNIVDYEEALYSKKNPETAVVSKDLRLAIGTINSLMTDNDCNLKSLEASLQELKKQAARDNMNEVTLAKNPLDALAETAKADIWLELAFYVEQFGPENRIRFELYGIDPYTREQIAGTNGTGQKNNSPDVGRLLEAAVVDHIPALVKQMNNYFNGILENGRQISMRIDRSSNSVLLTSGLNTDFGGKDLSEIIEDWVAENTVNGNFNVTAASKNVMDFDNVRIPLYNEQGRAIDARNWVTVLQKMLRNKYKIESVVKTVGLGQVILTLEEEE
jgi:hypothetical protein